MKWVKSALVGAAGSLVMVAIMMPLIGSDVAPFRIPPSAAALKSMGFPTQPLALIVHFGYGMVGSVILVACFGKRTDIPKGLGLAGILWLIMMLIHSPIIGWGFFGTADTSGLPEALQLGSTVQYIVSTFLLHGVYGLVIGGLNPRWIEFESQRPA